MIFKLMITMKLDVSVGMNFQSIDPFVEIIVRHLNLEILLRIPNYLDNSELSV